jgi:hypothetical protein
LRLAIIESDSNDSCGRARARLVRARRHVSVRRHLHLPDARENHACVIMLGGVHEPLQLRCRARRVSAVPVALRPNNLDIAVHYVVAMQVCQRGASIAHLNTTRTASATEGEDTVQGAAPLTTVAACLSDMGAPAAMQAKRSLPAAA